MDPVDELVAQIATSANLATLTGPQSPVERSHWDLAAAPLGDTDLIAVGADLEPATLIDAYSIGLFPMPVSRHQIGWFCPVQRGVVPLDGLHVSRSLHKSCRKFTVTFDHAFTDVMHACADPRRHGGWITDEIVTAYSRLHRLGYAHSVEVWRDGDLVGGVYGVHIDRFFAGESMFHRATDASKVALVALVGLLRRADFELFDVQWTTPHLASLGAIDLARDDYLRHLAEAQNRSPGRQTGTHD